MPEIRKFEIYCPKCGKEIGQNISAKGDIRLYCKRCKEFHLIKLNLN